MTKKRSLQHQWSKISIKPTDYTHNHKTTS